MLADDPRAWSACRNRSAAGRRAYRRERPRLRPADARGHPSSASARAVRGRALARGRCAAWPLAAAAAAGPARGSAEAGPRQRRRVGLAARQPLARPDPRRRQFDGRAADQAHARLAGAPDRPVVRVVDRADRLVRRREVALRIARATPEQRPGAASPPGREMALVAGRAGHLERERRPAEAARPS